VWLFVSYGYVLYKASDLISEGSELLLLVPSMAGLVGGVVLPLLCAVPDGAIVLFSGLGDIETAQERLSVGVGALAGSTIMLLTVPFALSIYGGRVDLVGPNHDKPNYLGKPKLQSPKSHWMYELTRTGVGLHASISHGGTIMACTLVPFLLIQVPALFLHGPQQEVAQGEHWWSLSGFLICVVGLIFYMKLQLQMSKHGEDRDKRMAVVKKVLQRGSMSLSGAIAESIRHQEHRFAILEAYAATEYQSINDATNNPSDGNDNNTTEGAVLYPPPLVAEYLKELLADAFRTYDRNGDGVLDIRELSVFFRDFHETLTKAEVAELFRMYDTDKSNHISVDEFIGLAYTLIKTQEKKTKGHRPFPAASSVTALTNEAITETAFSVIEHEEVPEEFTDLPPDEQQRAIQLRSFYMCTLGTILVVLFSDPMVDVMQEIAARLHISPFQVSFVLAPLASNSIEVVSSMYYASKKTSKTITLSLSTLQGAACMNNTFCLSIFMGLIFFRGLAWQYTAETIVIILTEVIVAALVQCSYITLFRGSVILSLFPLSIVVVAILEGMGLD
jgi:Ca2+/Na+ antiporter